MLQVVVSFRSKGIDIRYTITQGRCYFTVLPTSECCCSRNEAVNAVVFHAGQNLADCTLCLIQQDYSTGVYSVWDLAIKFEKASVRIVDTATSRCDPQIITALRRVYVTS